MPRRYCAFSFWALRSHLSNSDEQQGTIDRMARNTHDAHQQNFHDEQMDLPATLAAPPAAAAVSNGGGAAAGAGADAGATAATTATDLFNDATTRMVGGVGPDQVDKV